MKRKTIKKRIKALKKELKGLKKSLRKKTYRYGPIPMYEYS